MNSEICVFGNVWLILTSYIFISHISNANATLQCFNGKVTSAQTVEVKNCTRLVKNHSTNTSQSRNTSSHPLIEPSKISSKHCLIFRHLSSGESLIFNHNSFVKFSCDYENICDEKHAGKFIKYTYNNVTGELFCCNTSKCNLPQLTPLPHQALKCYHAKKKGEGTVVGCASKGGHCASTREFHGGLVRHQFFCDNENICNRNASIITEGCKNISLDNNTRYMYQVEICCCAKSLCNKPPWKIVTSTAAPVITNTTTPLMQARKRSVDWTFIGGLLGLLALMGGLIIAAVIFVRRSKKRENDPGLRFSYRRIPADQLETEEDDTVIGDNVQLVLT